MQLRKSGYGYRGATDLIAHLQWAEETERTALSCELHDEFGGLLVAATMDLAWVDTNFTLDGARQQLNRARQRLACAIDLKRKMVERLRPSILDTIGLFAALRWQLRTSRKATGPICKEAYPDEEPHFSPWASIALFRIFEELLAIVLRQQGVNEADISVTMDDETFTMRIAHDGQVPLETDVKDIDAFAFAATVHRARSLGGHVYVTAPETGGGIFTAYAPLSRMLVSG
jgi:signal transduction histidine kinase